ncbi:MAG: S41 family peptidase, partial [Opitutaceae bacterium]
MGQRAYDRAATSFEQAIALDPHGTSAYLGRGFARTGLKQADGAERDFDRAVERARTAPLLAAAYQGRGEFYLYQVRREEALEDLNRAIEYDPNSALQYWERAGIEWRLGDYSDSVVDVYGAVHMKPQSAEYRNSLAWFLAVCPDPNIRVGSQALRDATDACEWTQGRDASYLDTLAAAYAETGDFAKAIETQAKAVALTHANTDFESRLALYRAGRPYHEPAYRPAAPNWAVIRFRTFKTVWSTVNRSYFDPTFGGVDWDAVREHYRDRLVDAPDIDRLRALLRDMLASLRHTHFAIIPREAAVFDVSERSRLGSSGADCSVLPGGVVIGEVKTGSAAARARLRPGEIVAGIDGVDLAKVRAAVVRAGLPARRVNLYLSELVSSRLGSPAGTRVKLRIVGLDGKRRTVGVTCGPKEGRWSPPVGNFPSYPIHCEARLGADGIAYFRFDSFVPDVMGQYRALIRKLRPGDGLIIDLRHNSGGVLQMASGMAGWLCGRETAFGRMDLRGGYVDLVAYPQDDAFGGPVAVLIGTGSQSASEVLAARLQEIHRARVFGEASPGAVLSSLFRKLPDGDLLQYAVADVKTAGGVMLEGRGVTPDERIAVSRADLAAGRDPVLA